MLEPYALKGQKPYVVKSVLSYCGMLLRVCDRCAANESTSIETRYMSKQIKGNICTSLTQQHFFY